MQGLAESMWGLTELVRRVGVGTEGEDLDVEEHVLRLALEETYAEIGQQWMPWAANGHVDEIVFIVDLDTAMPEDCLCDAAHELAESPDVMIIQHKSGECSGQVCCGLLMHVEEDVMQVVHHWFENGIMHFMCQINKCLSMGVWLILYCCVVLMRVQYAQMARSHHL